MERNDSFSSLSRGNSIMSSFSYASSATGLSIHMDRTAHERDLACNCCGLSFSAQSLPKSCCTFCYRGVCPNCFKKESTHPESHLTVKICDNCLEKQIAKGTQLLEKLRSEISELREKYNHEQRAAMSELAEKLKLEEKLEELIEMERDKENSVLKEIHGLREENLKIEKEVIVLEMEYEEKMAEYTNFEKRIGLIQNEAEVLKDKHHDNNILESLKESLARTKEEYDELKNQAENTESYIQNSKTEELELEIKRDALREELDKAKERNAELQQIVKDYQSEEVEQLEKIERFEKNISIFKKKDSVSYIEIQSSKFAQDYNKLKEEINKKKDNIEKLKRDIAHYDDKNSILVRNY